MISTSVLYAKLQNKWAVVRSQLSKYFYQDLEFWIFCKAQSNNNKALVYNGSCFEYFKMRGYIFAGEPRVCLERK